MVDIPAFEKYLNKITDNLLLDKEEIEELRLEWHQHLVDIMNANLEKGLSQNEAIEMAIKQFGDPTLLETEVQKCSYSSKMLLYLKETLVWIICLIAASIGPIVLINAHYQLYFISSTLIFLSICAVIFHFVVKRFRSFTTVLIGTVLSYGTFVAVYIKLSSFDYFINQLVSFRLGGEGLFTILILHILWFFLIVIVMTKSPANKAHVIVKASFQYWTMNVIAVFFVMTELLTGNSEAKVILLNIFLLYGFLHQVVDPKSILTYKNKIKYWI